MSTAKLAAFKRLISEIANVVQKHTQVDLSVMMYQLDTALSLSPATTINTFFKDSQPYLKEIYSRDADFFLDMAHSNSHVLDIPIATVWTLLTDHERETIWTNVEKLIVLAESISNNN